MDLLASRYACISTCVADSRVNHLFSTCMEAFLKRFVSWQLWRWQRKPLVVISITDDVVLSLACLFRTGHSIEHSMISIGAWLSNECWESLSLNYLAYRCKWRLAPNLQSREKSGVVEVEQPAVYIINALNDVVVKYASTAATRGQVYYTCTGSMDNVLRLILLIRWGGGSFYSR